MNTPSEKEMAGAADIPDYEGLIDLEDPAGSESRLASRVDLLKSDPDSDRSSLIEVHSQLARLQCRQGRFMEARGSLQVAQALLEDPEAHLRVTAKIRFLIESGRLNIAEKTPSQARPLFLEALTLASNAGEDYHAIDAIQMLAAVEPKKMKKEWIHKALALAEGSPQPRARQWRGALHTSLGWGDYEVRQFEGALEHFKKALSWVKAGGAAREGVMARWAVAKTLRALNRVEEALEIQRDLVAELTRLNLRDGYVYEELAECLQTLKKTGEAQPYFDLAYQELAKDEWFADNSAARLKRLKELGKAR